MTRSVRLTGINMIMRESTDVGPCGSKPMQKEKKCENPFEKERLNHLRKATDCTYLRQIAQDVDFMENLLNDRRLKTDRTLPDETNKTNKKLRALFEDTLSKCSWWKKQMHQRTPLYARHKMRFLTKSAKSRAIVAYRMQKRVMNRVKARRILNNVTKLSVGSTKKLLGYIETTVYPFHSTIQENLFPNLKEFIEMIYETVGVVLIREMSEVKTTDVPNFLKLPTKKSKETTDKRKIIKLQNRLRFARYPLEKAYLAHKLFNMITPRLPELRVEAEAAIKELRNAAKTSS
ncbi:uncharacterized protein LOC129795273 [Lutzomyia longipalpis]|uniref:uncharacterized protein LOC129795273 n=1 Tax=Lutzomyia longipalpis TaxID=7200 RepID=UPI0024844248|nr:uncharacterized protein LOC129795273 [Lutzomyia longipalpis]